MSVGCGSPGYRLSLFLGKESALPPPLLPFLIAPLLSGEAGNLLGCGGSELALELETRSLEGPSSVGTAMQRHCSGSLLTGTSPDTFTHIHTWVQPALCTRRALLSWGWAGLSGTR